MSVKLYDKIDMRGLPQLNWNTGNVHTRSSKVEEANFKSVHNVIEMIVEMEKRGRHLLDAAGTLRGVIGIGEE